MEKTKKNKIILSILIGIISAILITCTIVSIIINIQNKSKFNQEMYIVIYQYDVEDFNIIYTEKPKILYKELFTSDLILDETFYTEDKKSYNHVIIKDSIVKITESNCKNEICMHTTISKDNILANTTITCEPHGLVIVMEVKK